MKNKIIYITTVLLLFSLRIVFAAPAADEQQMRDYLFKQKAAQISLLKKLVNINSGTTNSKGVKKIVEIVRVQLKQLGFQTKWVNLPKNMHHAGTLIAERCGSKGKKILLIGHLDTVFPPDSKFQRFHQEKMLAKGPGVLDDKGGVVVILYALKALNSIHALHDATITVVLTGDEEDSGKPVSISRKALIQAAQGFDVALDFEGAITLNTATIARRGITNWHLETHGSGSHSATIFQKGVGDGAIFELVRILNKMREQVPLEDGLSFNPGVMLGGTKVVFNDKRSQGNTFGKQNVVANIAMANGDYRFLTNEQSQLFKTKLETVVKQHLPNTDATITFEDAIPAMAPTDANYALMNQYSEVSKDLGYGEVKAFPPALRGAGDISHVAAIVKANLAGLGPTGFGAHSPEETVNLDSLPIQTTRTAVLIYRLVGMLS